MGEMLAGMEKQHGARTPTGLHDETPLLSDIGISKLQSQPLAGRGGLGIKCMGKGQHKF